MVLPQCLGVISLLALAEAACPTRRQSAWEHTDAVRRQYASFGTSQVLSLITTSGGLGMSGLTEIEVLERSTS